MSKKLFTLIGLLTLVSMILTACGTTTVVQTQVVTQEVPVEVTVPPVEVQVTAEPVDTTRTQVYWYIGLGTGAQPAQIQPEKDAIQKYNDSQTEIQLIPIIVDNKYAPDNLTAQLAAGNPPDIVGPVGATGRAQFPGAFLDLMPLVEKFKYDTSDIDPAFLEFYKDPAANNAMVGLPFAIYPSMVFVNKDLFDQAELPYPPQKVGDKYKFPDGTEAEWSFETMAKLGKLLTIDANGLNSTEAGFDAANIVQYGFQFQWVTDNPRWFTAYFGAYYPVTDDKKGYFPQTAIDGMKWYYDAMWGKEPFAPTKAAADSDLLNKGNNFASGKVAMAITHLWYTCCVDNTTVPNWDLAIIPSYNGKITAKMHGDTFAIMKDSPNPEPAFKAYTYLIGDGSADLFAIYGGLPARKSQQADFFKTLDEKYAPQKINWQVALDMIPYLEAPGHELGVPNNAKSENAFKALGTDIVSNGELDIDTRVSQFITEITAIYNEAPAQ